MADYYFTLPQLTSPPLTREQRTAINLPNSISLSGGPGTGKSVVSLYRHLVNVENGKSSQLLTFTTTLALYLSECCRTKSRVAASNVTTIFKWINQLNPREEVIIDEAQNVKFAYKRGNFFTYKSCDEEGRHPDFTVI